MIASELIKALQHVLRSDSLSRSKFRNGEVVDILGTLEHGKDWKMLEPKAQCTQVCIVHDLKELNIVGIRFSSNNSNNYPSFFNANKPDVCSIPEGILFIPKDDTTLLCVCVEMKSKNPTDTLNQLYAGKIMAVFMLETALRVANEQCLRDCGLQVHFIGFRFAMVEEESNGKLLRKVFIQEQPAHRTIEENAYQFTAYERDTSFYYNPVFHPCYSLENPQKMSLNQLVQSFKPKPN